MSKKTYSENSLEVLLTSEGVAYKIRNSTKKFYVYTIYGPTMGPIYVGKGSSTRVLVHEKQARSFLEAHPHLPYESWVTSGKSVNLPKIQRLASHLSYGNLRYRISLFTNSEEKAFKEEKRLIKLYGRAIKKKGVLSNLTSGGQGSWYSNNGGTPAGYKHSEVTKLKISKALAGKQKPEGFGETMRKALTGRKIPLSTRLKMGKSRIGIPRSEETRRKVSESRQKSDKIPTVPVKVHGITYPSMKVAANLSGYTYQQIVYRTRIGYKGFERL